MIDAENDKLHVVHEGIISEKIISDMLKEVDGMNACSDKLKKNIKIVIIESGLNIITHGNYPPFGNISIYRTDGGFLIEASNYTNEENLNHTRSILKELEGIEDLKEHYFNLLKAISNDKSVRLGLLKIYRMCNRDMEVISSSVEEKLLLKLKIKMNDND